MNFEEFLNEYGSIIKLAAAALIPVFFSAVFYILKKYSPFGKIPEKVRQIIIGIVFGGIAILGTHWGIPMNGAQANCRDAAPLCAGLLFGPWAGIVSGVIGGVERWIAGAYWGIGEFTTIACSVSTAIAGLYAAILRKYIFDNRRPGSILALAAGVVMEVFHLTMVFVTNTKESVKAAEVVRNCTVPLIAGNAISVFLAAFCLYLISGKHRKNSAGSRHAHVSDTIQKRMFICVAIAFIITSVFMYFVQTGIAENDALKYLNQSNSDVRLEALQRVADGDETSVRKSIINAAKNRHIMKTGYLIIADETGSVLSAPDDIDIDEIVLKAVSGSAKEDSLYKMNTEDEKVFASYKTCEDNFIISVLPCDEALETRNASIYINTFMEVLVFAALFILIYLCVKTIVVRNVEKVNRSIEKITSGDLDEKVNVRSNAEFESLSDGVNEMVDTLKKYIGEAEAKIAQELEVAKNIQASALPGVFPAFPGRKDFDIYALMNPAKEVGGDFYDFYLIDGRYLYFEVADVSGKGIPAAMFMMRAKTMLKSLAESGLALDEIMTRGNNGLCDGNDAGMFVTAWMCVVDLETGLLTYVNAGHNPPLVRHKDGSFEYLRGRSGLVLAGMEGMKYKKQEIQLEKGDMIFLYTDGVTEATNAQTQLYGEQRLADFLNSHATDDVKEMCELVKADVDAFVGAAPQFDDITILAARYDGPATKKEMHFESASISDITSITEFVESNLEEAGYPMKTIVQMNIAVDEIYSNIVKFAYGEKKGPATVILEEKTNPDGVMLTFIDEGIPYNPVKKEDPDVTLSAEERNIGGLGVFMVKKTMDDMTYEYRNDKNVLHIFKKRG